MHPSHAASYLSRSSGILRYYILLINGVGEWSHDREIWDWGLDVLTSNSEVNTKAEVWDFPVLNWTDEVNKLNFWLVLPLQDNLFSEW